MPVMSVLRLIDIETKNHRFTLALSAPSAAEGRFVARYWSTSDLSKINCSEDQLSGSVTHEAPDTALAMALAQIEKSDGPILRRLENDFTGSNVSAPSFRARG
jgi:hypothetical protein